jgi:hypothetical protein
MTINDATIASDVFAAVKTKLVASLTSASVNAVYNDKNGGSNQVVITPAFINEGFDKFGGTEGKKAITVVIMMYHKNTLSLDALSDEVRVALKANDLLGIDLVSIDEDYAFNLSLEDKLHSKSFSCAYLRE